jgi:hypothetical protein
MHKKFWTVTDSDTQSTNSRSKRFETKEAAIRECRERIARHKQFSHYGNHPGCYVLEVKAYVGPVQPQIEVVTIY